MPLQSPFSLLTLTDHCPAAQSSPAASLGYHLTALCPTAHCPPQLCCGAQFTSTAPVPGPPPASPARCSPLPSSPKPVFPSPSPPLQQPHCLPHPNPTALHAPSTGSSVSAPPHPKLLPFPTSLAVLFPTAHSTYLTVLWTQH